MPMRRSMTSLAAIAASVVCLSTSLAEFSAATRHASDLRALERRVSVLAAPEKFPAAPAAPRDTAALAVARDIAAALGANRRDAFWLSLLTTLGGIAAAVALLAGLAARRERRDLAGQVMAGGEALARSEGTRARFLEVIAHDLRQPLQAIELFSAGLARRHANPEAVPLLDGIRSALASMRRMLSGLMDISRLDAGAVAPVLVDVALADILAPLAAEFAPIAESRGLTFKVADGGAVVHSDPVMLECVLRNLVANALRYTDEGTVAVGCAPAGVPDNAPGDTPGSAPGSAPGNAPGNAHVAISVSDTGPGIPAAELSRIFQEFYRVDGTARRPEGLGLGLAIVRRMARLLDLSLEVASTPGRGSVFTVLVPAVLGARAGESGAAAGDDVDRANLDHANLDQASLALAGASVLLVDDDDDVRRGLGGELRALGMAVTAMASPAAACDLFAREPDRRFDIALVDRDLGAPLTGPQLLDHLAADFGVTVPALLLSGTQDFRVIAELQAAATPWLAKPVALDTLLREMARIAAATR